ncbi:neutral zinc metallopeptidase [Actinoplanes sp. NPDC089786]|uniref:neutral zinc metallopeptidase n=1 Tax=Actinoplanes sp. NPDC089786 TaxID=3155185 RepID=UPI00341B9FEF
MPVPNGRRPALLVAMVTALVGLGCVSAPDQPGAAPPEPDETPVTTASAGADADGTDTPEEFKGDIGDATKIAEEYWAGVFKQSGIRFEPVNRVIAYEREGEVDCGGQPLGLNNAAYCSDGDFIAYDVNWAFAAFQQVGDAFIFYLLGHEYAHAIQLRLGIQKQFTIQQELQADCMAGAYIGDMERQKRLSLQDDDTEELAAGLEAVGDEPGQPWFAEGSHGSAKQRTQAFANGYRDSLEPCNLS